MQTSLVSAKPAYRHVGENLYRRISSGTYYALLKKGGKQFRRSLKTSDIALARRRLSELREEVSSLVSHDAGDLTFMIVAERWQASVRHTVKDSTAQRRQLCVNALTPFFAGITFRNITPAHCERWVTKRGESISASSFAQELDAMRAVFDYAKDQGLILRNPAQSIKRKRIVAAKIEVPTRDQFRELVAAIRFSDGRAQSQAVAKDGADLVELLAYSGCRLDEARNIKWEDVSFERGSITITGGELLTKNYEARTIPMTAALADLLSRLQSEQKPAPGSFIVKINSAKKCLATACKKLGFHGFTHHDFRHFSPRLALNLAWTYPPSANGLDTRTAGRWR